LGSIYPPNWRSGALLAFLALACSSDTSDNWRNRLRNV